MYEYFFVLLRYVVNTSQMTVEFSYYFSYNGLNIQNPNSRLLISQYFHSGISVSSMIRKNKLLVW